nr:MAG TPA: hypothetical protein [Caudoviricetes sp.]
MLPSVLNVQQFNTLLSPFRSFTAEIICSLRFFCESISTDLPSLS